MKKLASILRVLAVSAGAGLWFASAPRGLVASDEPAYATGQGDQARGAIVFTAAGCASCHASPVPKGQQIDRTRLGGGERLKTDFGTFVVPNISSDRADGIGAWSTVDLANALLAGVSPKGSHYYPAFPYTTYAHMRPGDVADLMAYLRTLPPVPGRQVDHDLKFPFSQRRALGLWKILFLDRTPIAPEPGRSESWNRGHYLVEALGHCAECHSSRNRLGGIIDEQRYAGGPDAERKGWVPNITPSPDGLAKWSKADMIDLLTTGNTPDFDSVGSSMVDVVENTSRLPDSDRAAMADYLLSLRPVASPARIDRTP